MLPHQQKLTLAFGYNAQKKKTFPSSSKPFRGYFLFQLMFIRYGMVSFLCENGIIGILYLPFLGVIIDNKLKWSAHITYISKKISKGIGIILKARKVFNMETLLSLYHTFVYPYLSYCIHVWGKAYNTHLNDLIVLQNKAMRIISGVPPRTNIDHLDIENNILIVKHIYSYNIGLFMYKYVNNMTPDVYTFSEIFLIFISIIQEMPHKNYFI